MTSPFPTRPSTRSSFRRSWSTWSGTWRPSGRCSACRPGGCSPPPTLPSDIFVMSPINKTLETLFGIHPDARPGVGTTSPLREGGARRRHFPLRPQPPLRLGKPLLESGLLGRGLSEAADRFADRDTAAPSNPHPSRSQDSRAGSNHRNSMNEPPGHSTVNLCLKARKG